MTEKWVEAVYEAFKKKKEVWEKEQQEGHTDEALDEWGTAARMGERHLNPAFELTASGTGGAALFFSPFFALACPRPDGV